MHESQYDLDASALVAHKCCVSPWFTRNEAHLTDCISAFYYYFFLHIRSIKFLLIAFWNEKLKSKVYSHALFALRVHSCRSWLLHSRSWFCKSERVKEKEKLVCGWHNNRKEKLIKVEVVLKFRKKVSSFCRNFIISF